MPELPFASIFAEPLRNGVSYASAKRGTGTRMINMREIFANDRITAATECELVPLTDSEKRSSRLRPGDLLFARQSLTYEGAGKVSIVLDDSCPTWDSHLIRARLDPEAAVPGFYYYFFRSPEGRRRIETIVQQVAAAGIRASDLTRLKVPVPPLPVQQAIAEVLGALDDKIAANTALAKSSDALMRGEYEAWPDIVLTTVGQVAGSPRVAADPGAVEPTTPYVGLEHIERRTLWLTDFGSARDVTSGKSSFESADVLFGKLRPYFHKVVSAPMNGICSTDVLVVRALDPAMASVMLAAVASDRVVQAVVAASEGTRMPRTSWKDLAATEIPWPSGPSAKELAGLLDGIRDAALAALAENRTLAATRDALLPQLMSGKLRVRDAEKIVEAAT